MLEVEQRSQQALFVKAQLATALSTRINTKGEKRMKYAKVLATNLIILALIGCSGKRFDPTQYTEVASLIARTRDNFKKVNTTRGPSIKNGASEYFIRSFTIDGYSPKTFQIYAQTSSSSVPDNFDTAYDISGKRLPTTYITTKVIGCSRFGCSYSQHVGIDIDQEYLKNNRLTGVHLQLSSKSEKETIIIPAAYIQAFLDATK